MAYPASPDHENDGLVPAMKSRLRRWLQPDGWPAKILEALVVLALFVANAIKIVAKPIWRNFGIPNPPPLVVRTPDSRFAGLDALGYNFKANYVSFPFGGGVSLPRMHYVDEGPREEDGRTILCLHGEPSWSFLYRKMVPILVDAGYRVIVPDFIGFGKSDKYTSADNYTHELHTASIRLLLDHLGVEARVTLICQDWGGLTGLSVVKDMPDTFEALVLMNTGLPNGERDNTTGLVPFMAWRLFDSLFGNRLPVRFLFKQVFGFSDEVADAYDAPFPDWRYKGGAAQWPLLVPLFRDDAVTPSMNQAIKCLKTWSKPALVMFSDEDPVTRGLDETFMKMIPDAKKIDIRGAGHMLQETHGPELANNVVKFLDGKM